MDTKIVVGRIEQLMREKRISFNELKENTGLSPTVYQWIKNRNRDSTRCPELKSIEKICDFFKISLSEFFAVTDEERLTVKQNELLMEIKRLSENELDMVSNLVRILNEKGPLNNKL